MFVELNSCKLTSEKYNTVLSVKPVRKLIEQQKNGNFAECMLIVENILAKTLSDVLTAIRA